MPVVTRFIHNSFARSLVQLAIIFIVSFSNNTAKAEATDTKKDQPAITLSAPEHIEEFLAEYFELPEAPLADETAQTSFVRRARREISELLTTEGYFTPTITLADHSQTDTQVIEVDPGPLTRISEIKLEFRGDISIDEVKQRARIEQLYQAWLLKKGEPFRSSEWEKAKAELLSNVTHEDYLAASIVKSQAIVDPASASAKLLIEIDSGPAFYFGKLEITGLARYKKTEIKNFLPFQPGDPYRRDLLLRFQSALQAIPHFTSVIVSVEPDITMQEAVPVKVVLTERKKKRVSLGAGFSSNNGARGEVIFRNYNFLDRAWNASTLLRLEQKRQTFLAGIDTLPDEKYFQYSLGARLQRTDIKDLETINQKVSFFRNYRGINTLRQLGLSWQREEKRPAGAIQQTNEALALDWRWRHHMVDNQLHIRRGNVTEIRLAGGSQYLLSDRDFIRTYARQQFWWPIGKRDVLYLRGEAGYTLADSRSGIPQEFLFRAGGIQSLRGFDFLSLGVREGSAIVGGRTLATGTLEYTHWFLRNWGAAMFADVGDAADNWQKYNPSLGYGAGIRWRSPAGPLALDLARKHETGTLRIHFSMGVTF